MSDEIAVYLSPMGGIDDMYFTAGITAAEHQGFADLADVLPPLWKGRFQGHFFGFDATFGLGVEAVKAGVTHLALLEGPLGGTGSFFFDGDTISHNAVVLYYCEGERKYRYLHCRDCAVAVLKWMTEQQEAWSGNPRPAALVA